MNCRPWLLVWLALVAASCAGSTAQIAVGVTAPEGFTVELFAEGFVGPTQMAFDSNGNLLVAELDGGENDGTGRVLTVSMADPENRAVVHQGLDKPTGVAVTGDRLWIMERQRLSYSTLGEDDLAVFKDNLPSNGRSEGTLTVAPDGALLFNTSGSKRGPNRVDGSGILFRISDPAGQPAEPQVVATGFKHAYAHLFTPDGQLWSVEMTDGTFDDVRASDELLAVTPGDDAGWPQCVDNNRPVVEYGGNAQLCAKSPASHALFGVGATPTSLALAPWDTDTIVAALWLPECRTSPRSSSKASNLPSICCRTTAAC